MATYKLAAVIHEPSESTEPDKYMAEVPALPACVAWGDTPDDVLDILQSVATASIEVYAERGYELPDEVKASLIDSADTNSVLVAVSHTGNSPANSGCSAVNSPDRDAAITRFG